MAPQTRYAKMSDGRKCKTLVEWIGLSLILVFFLIEGCGGSGSNPGGGGGAPSADFSLSLSSSTISLTQGSSATASFQVSPLNGFSGTVQVNVSGLPAGISTTNLSINVNGTAQSGVLQLTAAQTAIAGNSSIVVHATSGSLAHSATLTLGLIASQPFCPTCMSARVPYLLIGGELLRAFNDTQRKLLFTSNDVLNEVDVVSTAGGGITRRINIPAPAGIDQMPDGKTLVVGTFTQGIYLIDEDTFAVRSSFVSAPSSETLISPILPLMPVAMSNGKVLFVALQEGFVSRDYYLGGFVYEWDPDANTYLPAPFTSEFDGPFEYEHIARSADRNFAVFNQSGGAVYLYNAQTDSYTASKNGANAFDVAANSDGTLFAESVGGSINFYDRALNLTGSVAMPTLSDIQVGNLDSGMQFSPDGAYLYVQGTEGYFAPLVVIDAKSLKLLGMIPSYFADRSAPPILLAAAGGGRVYESAFGGIGVVDCTRPLASISTSWSISSKDPNPDSLPLNTAGSVSIIGQVPEGTTALIDGSSVAVSVDSTQGNILIDVPPSSRPGPRDLQFNLPDGTIDYLPQAFAYGVTASTLSYTHVPKGFPSAMSLYGFGLVAGSKAPTVSFSGAPALVMNTEGYLVGGGSLSRIKLSVPPVSAPVDLLISNANGDSTIKSALSPVQTTVIPAAAGLSMLLFDPHRKLLYATRTNGSQIFVFDPGTMLWKSPIQPPQTAAGAAYGAIALTSDGGRLVALDTQNAVLSVFDPDNPSTGRSVSLLNSSIPDAPPSGTGATSVAVTKAGKAFVNVVGWYPAEIDLNTLDITYRKDPYLGMELLFRNSLDGSQFVASEVGMSSGAVSIFDSATDTFQSRRLQNFWDDIAISNDGQTIAANHWSLELDGEFLNLLNGQLQIKNLPAYPDLAPFDSSSYGGMQFSPQGTLLLVPRAISIDFIDATSGKLRARYATPEPLVTSANGSDVKADLAIDDTGHTVFAISASGLTVLRFDSSVDSLPVPAWPLLHGPGRSSPGTLETPINRAADHAQTRTSVSR
jgi:hypothetical protein